MVKAANIQQIVLLGIKVNVFVVVLLR